MFALFTAKCGDDHSLNRIANNPKIIVSMSGDLTGLCLYIMQKGKIKDYSQMLVDTNMPILKTIVFP